VLLEEFIRWTTFNIIRAYLLPFRGNIFRFVGGRLSLGLDYDLEI